MQNRNAPRWIRLCAGLLTCGTIAACGLMTAPVSLPEAFSHNGDLSLHGSISDDQGNPLDQVIVHVDRQYYLWHAADSYMEYSKLILAADHNFQIGPMRAHELTFTFTKAGYVEQHITVNQQNQTAYAMNLYTWPAQDVKIILPKAGRATAPLDTIDVAADYTDPDELAAININQALLATLTGGRMLQARPEFFDAKITTIPPGYLYADVQRQPLRTTGADHSVDPLDINLPARLTLHFSDPDGVLFPLHPQPGQQHLPTNGPSSGSRIFQGSHARCRAAAQIARFGQSVRA